MLLAMALVDLASVAAIFPFMSLAANPSSINSNEYLNFAYQLSGLNSSKQFLILLGGLSAFFLIASIAFKAYTTYATVRFTSQQNFQVGARLVEGYFNRPYSWFLESNTSDIGTKVLNDTNLVITTALVPFANLCAGVAVTAVMIGVMLFTNPFITLIAATILIALNITVYAFVRPWLLRLGEIRNASNQLKYKIVAEGFGAIKEIKILGLESSFLQRYKEPASNVTQTEAFGTLAAVLPKFLLEGIAFAGMLAVVIFFIVTSGDLNSAVPTVSLFALAGYRLLPTLQQIYLGITSLRFAGPAVTALWNDCQEIKASEPKNIDSAPLPFTNQIELRNVTFAYEKTNCPVIEDLSLTIKANTTVGFVGPTGSGKTTLIDLILGLLPPSNGGVYIDSQLLSSHNTRHWQRNIGYVPQQIFLSDDSIERNIAFGVEPDKIDRKQVETVSKIANLHEFVARELPAGYKTIIGEKGVRLSGGQRQRIGLARALYHSPKILVLDEATSALDNLTEEAVMDAMQALNHQITIIMIAHRLRTVRSCDTIFVLSNGQVEAFGKFSDLRKTNTYFNRLCGTLDHE